MNSLVTETPAASSADALDHFARRLQFETDCSDVHRSQQAGDIDYVLADVRSPALFAMGHIPGAVNLPTASITADRLTDYAPDTLFVVYCAGPHCNGVHRAALRLATLGFRVKEMIGGVTGWLDEGLSLDAASKPSTECGC